MTEAKVPPNMPDWAKDHIARYRATKGADGHMMSFPSNPSGAVPTLLLTTTGRRSGEKFVFPLIYGRTGNGGYVVIASKGGAPEHPGWYRNLVADPKVELQVVADIFAATARIASGAERTTLWDQMAKLFAPYNDYQKKAGGREIPVVVLERAP